MRMKRHISSGKITVDDVVSAIQYQDIYPTDFNVRRQNYKRVMSSIDDSLEGWRIPWDALSLEQERKVVSSARRLVRRREMAAARLIQIGAEEENFNEIMRSFNSLPKDDRTILQEMIYLGVRGADVCVKSGGLTERTIWRHRKAALEWIVEDCNKRRGSEQ